MDLYADDYPWVVLQKAAQVGGSEWLTAQAFWVADTGQGGRGNSLMLMPTDQLMTDFTSARINPVLAESEYLRRRLRGVEASIDRARLKAIGEGFVYLRGSESAKQVSAVDADLVCLDEYDRMSKDILHLAMQRLGSSQLRWLRIASTPTMAEQGINELFLDSDQRVYHLPCPSCAEPQKLTWPESIDFSAGRLVCRFCNAPMDVWARGEWIPEAPGPDHVHGYQISRLYSPFANIPDLIRQSNLLSYQDERQFQNQVLGEVYAPEESRISASHLDDCRGDYEVSDYEGQPCVMGVDVGRRLHVVIRERLENRQKIGRLWFAGDVEFQDLDRLLSHFNVKCCIVDGQPEAYAVSLVAQRHSGRVYVAEYRQQPGHQFHRPHGEEPGKVTISRTEALDELFQHIREQQFPLPRSARSLGGDLNSGTGDYYRQMLAPRRTTPEQDSHGNWTHRWVDGGKPDHYAHAEVYAMLTRQVSDGGAFVGYARF